MNGLCGNRYRGGRVVLNRITADRFGLSTENDGGSRQIRTANSLVRLNAAKLKNESITIQ